MSKTKEENYKWHPLKRIIDILYHPNFYWGNCGNGDVKYTQLRIDTRDNCAIVMDRNGKQVSLDDLEKAMNDPDSLEGMNSNPHMELTLKQ